MGDNRNIAIPSANMTKRYSDAQLKIREELAQNRVNPFDKAEKKNG